MWIRRNHGYEVDLINRDDCITVRHMKELISSMVELQPAHRKSIAEVVIKIQETPFEDDVQNDVEETARMAADVPGPRESAHGYGAIGRENDDFGHIPRTITQTIIATEGHDNIMINNGRWTVCGDLPADSCGVTFCIVQNLLLVIGGKPLYGSPSSKCNALSLVDYTWSRKKDAMMPKYRASAVVLNEDIVVLVGGMYDDSESSRPQPYDIFSLSQNDWRKGRNLPHWYKNKPLVAAVGQKVYILSRHIRESKELVECQPLSDKYNSKYVTYVPNDVTSTLGASLVSCGGLLYLLGGNARLAKQFHPLHKQWSQLAQPRHLYADHNGCGAFTTDNNTIIVCGGKVGGEKNLEEYNTQSNKWRSLDIQLPFQFFDPNSFVGVLAR